MRDVALVFIVLVLFVLLYAARDLYRTQAKILAVLSGGCL